MTKFQINKEIARIHWEQNVLAMYLANYFHILSNQQLVDVYTKLDDNEVRLNELKQMKKEVK